MNGTHLVMLKVFSIIIQRYKEIKFFKKIDEKLNYKIKKGPITRNVMPMNISQTNLHVDLTHIILNMILSEMVLGVVL